MKFCNEPECLAPSWRDGADEEKCVGHQVIFDPMAPVSVIEAAAEFGVEVAVMADLSIGDELICTGCAKKAPCSLAFYDTDVMAGEVLCPECAVRLASFPFRQNVHLRLDVDGANF